MWTRFFAKNVIKIPGGPMKLKFVNTTKSTLPLNVNKSHADMSCALFRKQDIKATLSSDTIRRIEGIENNGVSDVLSSLKLTKR